MEQVAVWMVTYNHERYIEEAILSVLNQKTSFEVKLFIGEDNSTDNTRNICLQLQKQNPDKIVLFCNEKNLGPMQNALQIYKACFESPAKYVAMLEGDDYWTDPLKLQKQVDFMEANPDFAICYHRMQVVYESDPSKNHLTNEEPEITTIEDLAKDNYIYTASCLFRNNLFGQFPRSFITSPFGDYFLHMLNAQFGKIKFSNDTMGVYRIHDRGLFGSKTILQKYLIFIEFQNILLKETKNEYKSLIIQSMTEKLDYLSSVYQNGSEDEIREIDNCSNGILMNYILLKNKYDILKNQNFILKNQLSRDFKFSTRTYLRNIYYKVIGKYVFKNI